MHAGVTNSKTLYTDFEIFGFSLDFTMDFTEIEIDFSFIIVHMMIINQA